MSEAVGFATSERFYDLATAVVYGSRDDDKVEAGTHPEAKSDTHPSTTSSGDNVAIVLSAIAAISLSYCVLIAALVRVCFGYTPKLTNFLASIGSASTFLALVTTFMALSGPVHPPDAGYTASIPGMINLEVGYALYVLLLTFVALVLVQRAASLDRVFAAPR